MKEQVKTQKRIMSIDAETDGLWGYPFAVAAIVYNGEGQEVEKFCIRLSDDAVENEWVKQNVLPTFKDIPLVESYEEMLKQFANFYMKHKKNCDVICHMGYIVEAYLLREMHRLCAIGDWDAPYPLYDISASLKSVAENPTSVDDYAEKYNLHFSDYGTTHNPLYDCEVTARVWFDIKKRFKVVLQ